MSHFKQYLKKAYLERELLGNVIQTGFRPIQNPLSMEDVYSRVRMDAKEFVRAALDHNYSKEEIMNFLKEHGMTQEAIDKIV